MVAAKARINGWINLDKPVGISSAKAVAIVRRQLNCSKIGHGGTLDPSASGVLPIALGEATKTVSYVIDSAKTYEFTLSWGFETTTDDSEGSPTRVSDKRPTRRKIENCLHEFIGVIKQTPPIYSAIKVGGRRAYAIARSNEKKGFDSQLELKPREVRIDDLTLASINNKEASFIVNCGKGTYIRSLGRDIARRVGSAGYVSALRRCSVGKFDINDSISLDFFTTLRDSSDACKNVLSLLTALDDIPALLVTPEEAMRIRTGQRVPFYREGDVKEKICVATCDGTAVALITLDLGIIHPVRVFNL